MKSLKTIQKIAKVLKVISIISLVCAVISFVATAILFTLWLLFDTNLVVSNIINALLSEYPEADYGSLIVMFTASVAIAALDVFLSYKVYSYLKYEISCNTPFDFVGAAMLRELGIYTIVISFATSFCQGAIMGALNTKFESVSSLCAGITLIILACVFRYGAELAGIKEQCEESANIEE